MDKQHWVTSLIAGRYIYNEGKFLQVVQVLLINLDSKPFRRFNVTETYQ